MSWCMCVRLVGAGVLHAKDIAIESTTEARLDVPGIPRVPRSQTAFESCQLALCVLTDRTRMLFDTIFDT